MSEKHRSVKPFIGAAVVTGGVIIALVVRQLYKFKQAPWQVADTITGVLFVVAVVGVLWLLAEGTILVVSPRKKGRRALRGLATSIGLTLVSLEILLRIAGIHATYFEKNEGLYRSLYTAHRTDWFHLYTPEIDYEFNRVEFDYGRRTNSEGLPDIEHPPEKAPGEYRILTLGDSYTEGVGVPFESSWPQVLQKRLTADEGARHVTVINGGMSGSDPLFGYVLLTERMLKYSPDLVTVCVNSSDIMDVIVRGGRERFRPDGTIRYNDCPRCEWLYAFSYVWRVYVHRVMRCDWRLLTPQEQEGVTAVAEEEIYASLLDYKVLAAEKGFKLVVIFHPDKGEARNGKYQYAEIVRRVREESGIPMVDVLAWFREEGSITGDSVMDYYWPLDGHHNVEGYALMAAGIYRVLEGIVADDTE